MMIIKNSLVLFSIIFLTGCTDKISRPNYSIDKEYNNEISLIETEKACIIIMRDLYMTQNTLTVAQKTQFDFYCKIDMQLLNDLEKDIVVRYNENTK